MLDVGCWMHSTVFKGRKNPVAEVTPRCSPVHAVGRPKCGGVRDARVPAGEEGYPTHRPSCTNCSAYEIAMQARKNTSSPRSTLMRFSIVLVYRKGRAHCSKLPSLLLVPWAGEKLHPSPLFVGFTL